MSKFALSNRVSKSAVFSCLVGVAACNAGEIGSAADSEEPSPVADGIGVLMLSLTNAPADVRCVKATLVFGSKTFKQSRTVNQGQDVSFTFDNLANGVATVSLQAYQPTCANVASGTAATWLSDEQSVVVTAGQQTPVSVILRRPGSLLITGDFQDLPPPPPPISPVVDMRFENLSGTNIADSSGRNNTGRSVTLPLPGAPTNVVSTAGHTGTALSLNGTSAITIADSDSIDETGLNNMVTLSAWVKVAGAGSSAAIVSRREVGTGRQQFYLGLVNGVPVARIHFFDTVATTPLPADGKFHHLAATYDGITLTLYVDKQAASFSDIGWPIAVDETAVVIGGNDGPVDGLNTGSFRGAIDDFKLFASHLTTPEIGAL